MEEFIGKVEAYNEELNKKPFKCTMCNYESSLKGNLTKHIDTVHDGKKPLISDTQYYQTDMNERSKPRPKTKKAHYRGLKSTCSFNFKTSKLCHFLKPIHFVNNVCTIFIF